MDQLRLWTKFSHGHEGLFLQLLLLCVLLSIPLSVVYSHEDKDTTGFSHDFDGDYSSKGYSVIFEGQLFSLPARPDVNVLFTKPIRVAGLTEDGPSIDDKANLSHMRRVNPGLNNLSDQQIEDTAMFMVISLTTGESFDIDRFYQDIEAFGNTSSQDEQILLLQLYGTLGRDIFDSEKIWNSKLTFFPNGDEITDDKELLTAMRAYLNGEDVRTGVCTDTGLILNKFAEMWGLEGGFVIGTNRTGLIHPSVVYYDTSQSNRTVAIVQDWDNVATFEFNTPEELANGIAEISGTHGLGKILFDGNGDVVRLIHSQSEKAVLKNLGQRELREHTDRLSVGEASSRRSNPRSSYAQTTIDFGEHFLEFHHFQTMIADDNIMITGGRRWEKGQQWRSSLRMAIEREFSGVKASFFDDHTNEHVKALARYDVEFSPPPARSSTMPLALETSFGMDTVLGYQVPVGSTTMLPFFTLPLLKPRAISVLKIFGDRPGPSVDVSMAIDGYFLPPRNVAETIGVVSPYLNVILDEYIANVRTWVPMGEDSRLYFDTGSVVTPTDWALRGAVGAHSFSGTSGEVSVQRGFPRGQLPVFYRRPRYDVAGTLFVPLTKFRSPIVTLQLEYLGTVEEFDDRVAYDSQIGIRLAIAY